MYDVLVRSDLAASLEDANAEVVGAFFSVAYE